MKHFLSNFLPAVLLSAFVAGCGDAPKGPELPPDDGSADFARGQAELEKQNLPAAAAAFESAARKNATNFEARVQVALVNLRLGEIDAADAAAADAIAVEPESAEARLVSAQAAYLKKDYRRALEAFDAVAAEKSLPAALRSDALVGRGVVEMAQNASDEARISFIRAMRANRRSAAAWYHLAVLARDIYRFNEAALEQFEMASRFSDPRDARAKKLSRDVLPALRKAIASASARKPGADKRDLAAAAKLLAEGEALQKKKMIRGAIKKYEAALKADPLSDAAALKVATLVALNDKTAAGVDKALGAYRTVIDQQPQKQANYLAAARLAYENKRWATAAAIMDRAIAHDPENRQTLDLLIASLQKAGKTKQAECWKAYRAEVK